MADVECFSSADADSEPIARGILDEVGRQREGSQAQGTQADDLIIVTFVSPCRSCTGCDWANELTWRCGMDG